MKIYLVGGAVRDQLLGLPIKEKDWVVVGATADEMLKLHYQPVGKDFPVFLHPHTKEEYALARLERKISRGYTGFNFDASPIVTLEEDLMRRDLTINAIAQNVADGTLVDPFHGQEDLKNKILRHVSPAFVEDPVRILRLGRFAARFAPLRFTIAPETMNLMREMVKAGEVDALVPERVWKELERALQEQQAEKFFEVLADCGALAILFPTINSYNIDALKCAAPISQDPEVRFAAFVFNHSVEQIKELCSKYRLPSSYQELALIVVAHYEACLNFSSLSASELLKLFLSVDAFRREIRYQKFIDTCKALQKNNAFDIHRIFAIYKAAKSIETKNLMVDGLSGKEIGDLINTKRLEAIQKFISK